MKLIPIMLLLASCFVPADRGEPDLYLQDGSPCWYSEHGHRLWCERGELK